MVSLNIAVVGSDAAARQKVAGALAKKSQSEDLGLYHTVFSGKKVNVLEPSAYPEKPQALVMALNAADFVVFLADPNPFLGETLVLLSALGKSHGCAISQQDVSPFLAAANLTYKQYDSFESAKPDILSFEPYRKQDGPAKAWLDHAFDVRGVGSVALGFMVEGKMHVHDKLAAMPSKASLEIRSIQQNDVDVEHAEAGDRFGIKFKGPAVEELGRGVVLGDVKLYGEIEATVSVPKYWKTLPSKNLHAVSGFQSVPCIVDKDMVPGTTVECLVKFHKPVALRGDSLVLLDLDAKALRVAGVATGVG